MKLQDLIQDISIVSVHGSTDREILAVTFDSRKLSTGCLFVAISGSGVDGHKFIPQAEEGGATAILCEQLPAKRKKEVCYIETKNSRMAIALIASEWYAHPSREIQLVGVTGTNGKTTIATLLYKVNTGLGFKAGILTTIEVVINGKSYPATHTTPDPMEINRWLREMVDQGCEYCFMEVSSHAASQHRIGGLTFRGAIFTNLTQDHLDYHKDFREYLEAKKSFFDQLDKKAFALTNSDDKNGLVMLQNCDAQKYSYGLTRMTDFSAKILEARFEGMGILINGKEVWVRLTGRFNAYNILAVYAASVLLGQDEDQVLQELSNVGSVEGRFEIRKGKRGSLAILDYAHTEDALKNVLETIHEVNREKAGIITVVGAGGARDRSKRPKMGKVAAELSTTLILTSDNPRNEDPNTIMEEMERGVPENKREQVLKIVDREEAIKTACMLAGPGSIILVAGKGHEKYQEVNDLRRPFDDKAIIDKYLK